MIENKNLNVEIYWDDIKKIPLILDSIRDKEEIGKNNYKYIGRDIRPVFLEEKWLILKIYSEKYNRDFLKEQIWATKQGRYIINGELEDISIIKESKKYDLEKLRIDILGYKPTAEEIKIEKENIRKYIEENKKRMNFLLRSEERDEEGEYIGAYKFIEENYKKFSNRITLVSFSGGKDSTVVSHLVRKALNDQEILHIYGDTTLELPDSYSYVEKFKEDNPNVPFFEERNMENDFFKMCEEIGPPSRVKTWCCSIFKTGPMGTTLASFDENILTFLGMRRSESISRSKYKKVSQSPKILKQMVALPIIDWLDADVWLYLFGENLDFNLSYRKGFARVGCWVCPNNGGWSQLLSSVYNGNEYDKWYNFLIDFAKKIGKEDYIEYVQEGKWKARHGGSGLENSKNAILETKECINDKNSKNYKLVKEIDNNFYELFKPFGVLKIIDKKNSEEIFILNREQQPLFKILCGKNSNEIKVTIIDTSDRYIYGKIEKQLNKFNNCLSCQGCNSACPTGAISVMNGVYKIDVKKCVHCLKCVDKFDSGCLIASALKIKKGK